MTEIDQHRTRRNYPIPDMLCGWNSCVFLLGHEGPHTWEQDEE